MLRPSKPRRLETPITISLEALVPRDHFYRHVDAKLDLSFRRRGTGERDPAWTVTTTPAIGGFFNGLGRYRTQLPDPVAHIGLRGWRIP